MMIIHNATFMVKKALEPRVVAWLKEEIAATDTGAGYAPRISAMREAGGVSHEHADAASVAFQLEFPDIDSARCWSAQTFDGIADRFTAAFGGESMVFTSLFEIL
ncbi:MAG: DUF4286 family protein [Muribaculaceae bacterium]|nr:DUF4286 family protein [Muribaculaceae bacterium]